MSSSSNINLDALFEDPEIQKIQAKLELTEVQQRLKGFEHMQSWQLESDEKRELKKLLDREQELTKIIY